MPPKCPDTHISPMWWGHWSYAVMSSEVIIESSKTVRGHVTKSTQIKNKCRITVTSQEATEESTPVVKSKPWGQEGKPTLQEKSSDWNLGRRSRFCSSLCSPWHAKPNQDKWHHYDPCWPEVTPGISRGPPTTQWYFINSLSESLVGSAYFIQNGSF